MILYYSVLFTAFFLLALVIRINRFVFYDLAENSVSLVNYLISDIEEDIKINKVQKTTNKLVVSLFKMSLVFILSIAIGGIPVIIYALLTQTEFQNLDFTSFFPILIISSGATLAFIIPIGKKSESPYSELSQLLHKLALDNYYISNKLFKQETKKIKRKNLLRGEKFVIVSGLARAGTTSLMNDLANIDDFVSLGYANMPFLLCPNIWAKFYNPKNKQLKERSHKDGIMIGLNSNEALEEYFFKVKANDAYIKDHHLSEYEISPDDYNDYLDYQSIIKPDNKKIYLAKNNNFILRYKSVRDYNDNFIMVILYRDPLSHAGSLMEKHRDYTSLQSEDPFVLEYMNWLGHHEFGKNQKPFVFRNSDYIPDHEKETLDYWLERWINFYSHVLTIDHPNTILINYNTYCNEPGKTIEAILKKTGIATDVPNIQPFKNRRKLNAEFSRDVYEASMEVYNKLNNREYIA